MLNHIFTIDSNYKYQVTDRLAGGMGYVFLLSLVNKAHNPALFERLLMNSPQLAGTFRYPYLPRLAAKTIKETKAVEFFKRECNVWLEMEQPGLVPLLKVVDVDGMILALMRQYSGSLRDLMLRRDKSRAKLLHALIEPVTGLAAIHKSHGVVHQDIKPENFLYHVQDGKLNLSLSDWGIANVQASQLPTTDTELSQFAINTMSGFGTLPYMAPERFQDYISDIRADIFSLGIMLIEITTGAYPYDITQPIERQILDGSYFKEARTLLSGLPTKFLNVIMQMVQPEPRCRLSDYGAVLKVLAQCNR